MNLRKTYFILPNLFTLGNVFCGFFALTRCAGAARIEELYEAALAICFGLIFDLFDGRVARLTRTQSELGLQLDSLADVISFGAAPAMLVYKWGLTQFGLAGVFIAFLFVAAAALRLARFNVLTQHEQQGKAGRYFLGLPTPAAASMIVALVVVHYRIGRIGGSYLVVGQSTIATLVVILAYLMVSRVRFRSFKDIRLTKRTLGLLFVVALICAIIIARLRASFIFVFLISCYLALGLTEEVFHYAAERRRERREAKLAAGEPLTHDELDVLEDETDVLRALGFERPSSSATGADEGGGGPLVRED
ncbi:MAG: CDP-diacylglycerol--serine O-phosphatidyltransferase [Proteobacteria bacterium]|nr:CDP-diacylglycerol--serine O-phosphatidyltransferase [Pseudomonadota bacterium]